MVNLIVDVGKYEDKIFDRGIVHISIGNTPYLFVTMSPNECSQDELTNAFERMAMRVDAVFEDLLKGTVSADILERY